MKTDKLTVPVEQLLPRLNPSLCALVLVRASLAQQSRCCRLVEVKQAGACGRVAAVAALIAVNMVFLTAEHLGSKPGTLSPVSGAGAGVTYTRGAGLGLGGGLGAAPPGLLMVQLEQLQPLCQCQLLLNGHAQQRVECLLLILSRCQLSLHLIQLCDVLVTPAWIREDDVWLNVRCTPTLWARVSTGSFAHKAGSEPMLQPRVAWGRGLDARDVAPGPQVCGDPRGGSATSQSSMCTQ